jgi:protease-4
MKRKLLLSLIVLSVTGFSQSGLSVFQDRTNFLFVAPGASGTGLYGYDNPALLGYLRSLNAAWLANFSDQSYNQRWGLFFGLPNLGFNFINQEKDSISETIYNLAFSLGSRTAGLGLGYEWGGGDPRLLKIGTLLRPSHHLSLGITGTIALSSDVKEGYVDLAFRPPKFEEFTFFGEYSLQTHQTLKEGLLSGGFCIEPRPGLRFTGRAFGKAGFSLGMNLSFGFFSAASQTRYVGKAHDHFQTWAIRMGGYEPNIFRPWFKVPRSYLALNLYGPVKYQGYMMFDRTQTLLGLITLIGRAKKDPTVRGIALNLSGLVVDREQAWELREKLRDFKSGGKRVVVYIDNAGMVEYHLASVADRIVLDPCGQITMLGTLFGRFYLKGTLEKLGIGIDEWRFFKYKSAAETFARDDMSEADREQWQKIVDDAYQLIRQDVCAGRGFTPDEFDAFVDDAGFFLPVEARDKKLVDTIGRWDAVEKVVQDLEGRKRPMIGPAGLVDDKAPYDNYWGERPRIAVVYALGECAMETGIKARKLVKDVEAVAKDSRIKAVVFRVDSPGGDALASDIVAEALRLCGKKKPVIVSQGMVAGSGGYWLSMYGDTIVAAPNTITGSIGVIGLWLYNKELKEKLGISTDHVQDGAHADMDFGFSFPLLGTLPDRNLTEAERARMTDLINEYYREFLAKVAAGRRTTVEAIEPYAQGRVWSGSDGRENGLVDVLGGLDDAIRIAMERAGLTEKSRFTIVEYPKPEFINFNVFQPKLIGIDETQQALIDLLKFYARHNGQALTILPMELMLSAPLLFENR